MANKKALPNGCSYSISVSPKNWKTAKANANSFWFISYRFYENAHKPFQVIIKGMNTYKLLREKQAVTQSLLNDEIAALEVGYNPRKKEIERNSKGRAESYTLESALLFALEKKKLAPDTQRVVRGYLNKCIASARRLNYCDMPVTSISRKHIIAILDDFPDNIFNECRARLSMLFDELITREIINSNPIDKHLKKRKTVKRIREVLTLQQRIVIDKFLRENHYTFWRYLQIFYHAGVRNTELFQVRKFHVDLAQQRYKATIKKGNFETWKIVTDEALPLWIELINEAGENDYLFAKGLKPGVAAIKSYQITKRWGRLIRNSKNEEIKMLAIKATPYSLKHLKSTSVSEVLGAMEAAKLNSHKSEAMVAKVYDINFNKRKDDELKSLKTPFAK